MPRADQHGGRIRRGDGVIRHMDTLYRQLAEHLFADDATTAWLLIDAMQGDVRDYLSDDVPDEDIHVVPLGRRDIPCDRYPHLIAVREHDVERLHASLEVACNEQGNADIEQECGFAIGGWLISDAKPPRLTRHLAACMNQRMPGHGRKYFRWADRRVMAWMWPSMDASARAALLGPIATWWTLDRREQLVAYRVAQNEKRPELSWRGNDSHWQHAGDCEAVQALLRGWQRFEPALPHDYLERAGDAVHSARLLGLTSMSDLVLVGAYVLQVHPNLCEHSLVRAQVRKAMQESIPLVEALGEIPDPTGWDRIRAELTRVTTSVTRIPRSSRHG